MVENLPAWLRELDRLTLSRTQIYLHGNVKDSLFFPGEYGPEVGSLRSALFAYLKTKGYAVVGAYNQVDGIVYAEPSMSSKFDEMVSEADKALPHLPGRSPQPLRSDDPVVHALQQIRLCLTSQKYPSVFVIEHAAQLVSEANRLCTNERLGMLRILRASGESVRAVSRDTAGSPLLQNLTLLVCDQLTEMPPWLILNNPFVGSVELSRPTRAERQEFLDVYLPNTSFGYSLYELAEMTEGMTYRELIGVRALAQQPNAPKDPKKLVDLFLYGARESQWDSLRHEDLLGMEEVLERRVMGQPAAITAVSDVLRRARLHLSGAQHSSRTKPRGVLFFAGPTGVGKTELAKSIAELVFGSDEMCVRFDMSEYSQSHSDQRLLGAPPGYVGYEEGGQLTNRVRSNPFCVLLFDEIEKAHPSILDKFLQILEDGRMTDGRGETVYFGESIIIFTSNAGIYQIDPVTLRPAVLEDGRPALNVDPQVDTQYEDVRRKVTDGVHNYFKQVLGRPELLNRIGRNIVVFDFVRPPVMRRILERKVLGAIQSQVAERWKIDLQFAPEVVEQLLEWASADVASGGRGVGNLAEVAILNPLSRVMFELWGAGRLEGSQLLIREIREDGTGFDLDWEECRAPA